MKRYFLILILCLTITEVQGQNMTFEQVFEAYIQGRYADVIGPIKALRGEDYKKHNWEINYMLSSCYCKTGDLVRGRKAFNWMLGYYKLDEEMESHLENQVNSCATTGLVVTVPVVANSVFTNVSRVSSKVMTIPKALEGKGVEPIEAAVINPDLEIDFAARKISKESKPDLTDLIKEKPLGPNGKVRRTKNFLIFGDKSNSGLKKIGQSLESVLDFYVKAFDLQIPEDYIQVFVFKSQVALRDFSREYHNLSLVQGTLGYTYDSDLSILAIQAGTYTGTLRHELFHLISHHNLGSMPPWLDEGLAALYEVSHKVGSEWKGQGNWRKYVIRENGGRLIEDSGFSLETSMNEFNWSKADAYSTEELITYLAIYRYMFLYLQEQGYLADYFKSIKDNRLWEDDRFYQKKLEEVTGKDISVFQEEFLAWLKAEVKY